MTFYAQYTPQPFGMAQPVMGQPFGMAQPVMMAPQPQVMMQEVHHHHVGGWAPEARYQQAYVKASRTLSRCLSRGLVLARPLPREASFCAPCFLRPLLPVAPASCAPASCFLRPLLPASSALCAPCFLRHCACITIVPRGYHVATHRRRITAGRSRGSYFAAYRAGA